MEDRVSHSCRPALCKLGAFLICGPVNLENGALLPGVVPCFPEITGGVVCPPMGISILPLCLFSSLLPVRRVDGWQLSSYLDENAWKGGVIPLPLSFVYYYIFLALWPYAL